MRTEAAEYTKRENDFDGEVLGPQHPSPPRDNRVADDVLPQARVSSPHSLKFAQTYIEPRGHHYHRVQTGQQKLEAGRGRISERRILRDVENHVRHDLDCRRDEKSGDRGDDETRPDVPATARWSAYISMRNAIGRFTP